MKKKQTVITFVLMLVILAFTVSGGHVHYIQRSL